MKPIAIDLFCGLGGWAEGLLAEGYDVIGYDIEAHDYGTGGYPGKLIIRDVLTKAASALIAKIPLPLSVHIARTFKPTGMAVLALTLCAWRVR